LVPPCLHAKADAACGASLRRTMMVLRRRDYSLSAALFKKRQNHLLPMVLN
jgi:hypothetical protein